MEYFNAVLCLLAFWTGFYSHNIWPGLFLRAPKKQKAARKRCLWYKHDWHYIDNKGECSSYGNTPSSFSNSYCANCPAVQLNGDKRRQIENRVRALERGEPDPFLQQELDAGAVSVVEKQITSQLISTPCVKGCSVAKPCR